MYKDYSVNRKIRQIIEDKQMSVIYVADRTCINRDTFSRIINSQRPIYAEELITISAALGCTVEYLLDCDSENKTVITV
jgi:transcriptional regulator with XRE-family HTH domain